MPVRLSAVISAIHGLGGIEKTTLAWAVAHNDEVRRRFSDGVLWVLLGQYPAILELLNGWIQALAGQLGPTTVNQASALLRSLLDDRSVLIVIDAWEPEHVRPFLVGGQRCWVLITTRRADVADEVGAKLHELDILNSGYDISGSFYNVHTTGGLLSAGDHAPCPEPSHS